jgi:tetratricopeptide (TPR) repeat protein
VDLSQEWAVLSEQAAEPVEAAPTVEAKPTEPSAKEKTEIVLDVSAELSAVEAAPVSAETQSAAPAAVPGVPAAEAPPSEEYELELTPAAPPASTPAKAETSADFLAGLAAEVEGLEIPSAPAKPATPPEVPAAAKAVARAQSIDQLKEVFDEFRGELGEMGEEAEDPETHYNLGIAYREMGLLEEAIGEFQKVAKTIQKGVPFRYAMQCCTLLGLSFMDKGQADIAAMWYQKALETPGLDQETILALRYDLGVAQEAAGDSKGALNSFNHVYAMNIDYRDVAERIAALQKAQ